MEDMTMDAYHAGHAAAKELKVGDVFLGASPEAERRGFLGPDMRHFINGYLDGLPGDVVTDALGRVVRFA
jgi:hypothetical protein